MEREGTRFFVSGESLMKRRLLRWVPIALRRVLAFAFPVRFVRAAGRERDGVKREMYAVISSGEGC